LESDLTSQRVKIGMHGMAKEHRWPNNRPPIGYDLADDQTLKINEEEAQLVRRIFRMYLDHRSMPEVAHQLNEQGLETKQDEAWGRWSIRKVLSNDLYRGEYQLGEYEDHVEEYRIISDELFEAVTRTRYRFKYDGNEMSQGRKESKAEKIFEQFKSTRKNKDE
jgi:site-specific DNA recombinase